MSQLGSPICRFVCGGLFPPASSKLSGLSFRSCEVGDKILGLLELMAAKSAKPRELMPPLTMPLLSLAAISVGLPKQCSVSWRCIKVLNRMPKVIGLLTGERIQSYNLRHGNAHSVRDLPGSSGRPGTLHGVISKSLLLAEWLRGAELAVTSCELRILAHPCRAGPSRGTQ